MPDSVNLDLWSVLGPLVPSIGSEGPKGDAGAFLNMMEEMTSATGDVGKPPSGDAHGVAGGALVLWAQEPLERGEGGVQGRFIQPMVPFSMGVLGGLRRDGVARWSSLDPDVGRSVPKDADVSATEAGGSCGVDERLDRLIQALDALGKARGTGERDVPVMDADVLKPEACEHQEGSSDEEGCDTRAGAPERPVSESGAMGGGSWLYAGPAELMFHASKLAGEGGLPVVYLDPVPLASLEEVPNGGWMATESLPGEAPEASSPDAGPSATSPGVEFKGSASGRGVDGAEDEVRPGGDGQKGYEGLLEPRRSSSSGSGEPVRPQRWAQVAESPGPVSIPFGVEGSTATGVPGAPQVPSRPQVPVTYRLGSVGEMALGEALIRIIPLSSSDQGGRAEMVVEPPSMGRVEVELSVQDGAVTANIRVENRELLGIVQAQSQRLKESLEAQGLQVMGLSVDLRNDENRPRGGGDQRRGRSRLNPGSDQEASLFRVDLREGLLHWLA